MAFFFFLHGKVSLFYTAMLVDFIFSVNIAARFIVCLLLLLLLILFSLSLSLFLLALLLLLLSKLYSHDLFYLYFNVTVPPVFIIVVELCMTCTLNNVASCSIVVEPYETFKTKFVQRYIVN